MKTTPNLEEIKTVLSRHFNDNEHYVFLFGSRADGSAHPNSDWDIGILSKKPLPGCIMEMAREDLEFLPTLHTLELVDMATTSPGFRKVALRRTISLIGEVPDE